MRALVLSRPVGLLLIGKVPKFRESPFNAKARDPRCPTATVIYLSRSPMLLFDLFHPSSQFNYSDIRTIINARVAEQD